MRQWADYGTAHLEVQDQGVIEDPPWHPRVPQHPSTLPPYFPYHLLQRDGQGRLLAQTGRHTSGGSQLPSR